MNLFRLESTYDIRTDMEDVIPRMKAFTNASGETQFAGWSRMAQPITGFSIVEMGRPKIGENRPSSVRADIQVHLNVRPHIKTEWEGLRKHDVGFLITLSPPNADPSAVDTTLPFPQQFGIIAIRGCEIEGILNDKGQLADHPSAEGRSFRGDDRTYRVWLDCNQYQSDLAMAGKGHGDVYESFNLFMRRRPKENNFKAILETIRDLMNTATVVPPWLNDVFLGYGSPGAAHYTNMEGYEPKQNFNDTFLSSKHVEAAFAERRVEFDGADLEPPFVLEIKSGKASASLSMQPRQVSKKKNKKGEVATAAAAPAKPAGPLPVKVSPVLRENRGPYPFNRPRSNQVPFTPTQVEAIRAGMQPGLNVIVGPPGTGKTDVAVQIISNIYHNHPEQRTLIVTHSNTALNQLFEKIMDLDIDQRHLLRLGRGEEDLKTDEDMGRYGRVDFILAERIKLLDEVRRLASTLDDVNADVGQTCETAGHFFTYHVSGCWEKFKRAIKGKSDAPVIAEHFPFHAFFENAPQPLFSGADFAVDMVAAKGCMRYIEDIFTQLKEFRAFEILQRGRDRSRYLLVKEAKIIAMTCTHAAIARRDLVKSGFKYDNVLMEESAQILEIETFIPLLLQNSEDGRNRLKRVTLIGDHHQLPPVIKNMAFKKFSNMEQSLFTRFIRLGVPKVQLDAQGRARPSLSSLYQWKYDGLGNLPHTIEGDEFVRANAGFRHDFQMVDVQDFEGRGEHCPELHFFQNIGEAEYLVAVFMYMRLLGYPAEKITMLTTYNGQKDLLRDVVNKRCAGNPLFGTPRAIETVDKYQGSQNNYVLLSLVRTLHVGHIRDVRRLIVAVSRARLGLYVFGRTSLFEQCHELAPVMKILKSRPQALEVYPNERFGSTRANSDVSAVPLSITDMPSMGRFVYDLTQHVLSGSTGPMPMPQAAPAPLALAASLPVPGAAAASTAAPTSASKGAPKSASKGTAKSTSKGTPRAGSRGTPKSGSKSKAKGTPKSGSKKASTAGTKLLKPPAFPDTSGSPGGSAMDVEPAAAAVAESDTAAKAAVEAEAASAEAAVEAKAAASAAASAEAEAAATPPRGRKRKSRGEADGAAADTPTKDTPTKGNRGKKQAGAKKGRHTEEEAVETPEAAPEPVVDEAVDSTESIDPTKLKVTELREELEKRGLETKGLKKALVTRLSGSLKKKKK
jgi:intron-binding protein aquarius